MRSLDFTSISGVSKTQGMSMYKLSKNDIEGLEPIGYRNSSYGPYSVYSHSQLAAISARKQAVKEAQAKEREKQIEQTRLLTQALAQQKLNQKKAAAEAKLQAKEDARAAKEEASRTKTLEKQYGGPAALAAFKAHQIAQQEAESAREEAKDLQAQADEAHQRANTAAAKLAVSLAALSAFPKAWAAAGSPSAPTIIVPSAGSRIPTVTPSAPANSSHHQIQTQNQGSVLLPARDSFLSTAVMATPAPRTSLPQSFSSSAGTSVLERMRAKFASGSCLGVVRSAVDSSSTIPTPVSVPVTVAPIVTPAGHSDLEAPVLMEPAVAETAIVATVPVEPAVVETATVPVEPAVVETAVEVLVETGLVQKRKRVQKQQKQNLQVNKNVEEVTDEVNAAAATISRGRPKKQRVILDL